MKALIVLDYIKSYRYVPPASIFLIMLVVNYTYAPNPILSSYALTAIYLFFITAWLTLSFFHTEDSVQQNLTILHAKSKMKYFLSKYFTMFLFVLILAVVSVVYPIVFHMFGEPVTSDELIIGFLSHLLLGVLSVSISVLFTRNIVMKLSNAWLGVSLALVVSLTSIGLKSVLPAVFQPVICVLPPVPGIIGLMEEKNIQDFYLEFGFVYLWLCMYSCVLIALFLLIDKKKGQEMF